MGAETLPPLETSAGQKKITARSDLWGKRGRFVEDNWTNCGEWRLTPFSYIGLMHILEQIIGPTFANYFK
jgi:hypothetical protein